MRVSEARPGQTIAVKTGQGYAPTRYTVSATQDYPERVRAYSECGNLCYLFPEMECRTVADMQYAAYCEAFGRGQDTGRD